MKPAKTYTTVASWAGALLAAVGLLALAPACVGMHGQGGLDSIGNSNDSKPVVEAFIEYPGPQDRWAGPTSLVVHVTARDGTDPTITLSPGVFQPEAGAMDFTTPIDSKRTGLTTSIVRERLALVATSLSQATSSKEEPVAGCLSPIRARLIRSDGSLLEKRGCRGSMGWAFQASDAATDLITMAENGPARMPASKPLTPSDVKAAEKKATTEPAPHSAAPSAKSSDSHGHASDSAPSAPAAKSAVDAHHAPAATMHAAPAPSAKSVDHGNSHDDHSSDHGHGHSAPKH